MNAIQIVGSIFVVLGVLLLGVGGFARLRVPAGQRVRLERQDALLPAGAGLFLIGLALMLR